jgi:ABC-type transport system involved in cytochrome bd biosynthesis fused ATPase/permease subunit
VLIARALYRSPGILFLDEATSHLDVERERAVNNALRLKRMTRIVIAHRPETIRASGRVITLRDGEIAETVPAVFHNGHVNGTQALDDETWLFEKRLASRTTISLPQPAA